MVVNVMSDYKKFINKVYSEIDSCIIIGLTGRTGSGCSTVAQILQNEEFEQLALPMPKTKDYTDVEERKYAVIHKYMSNNWEKFDTIEVSSVILSFVFEYKFSEFKNFILNLSKDENNNSIYIPGRDELIRSLSGLKQFFENKKFSKIEDIITAADKDREEKVSLAYSYYTEKIKNLKKSVYNLFKDFSCYDKSKTKFNSENEKKSQFYTYIMQMFGNNLRCSGNPFKEKCESPEFDTVAKRIDDIISIIKIYNNFKERKSRICIDALRNPFEVYYLRDRHPMFFLISISTDDSERIRRLYNLDSLQLLSLDEMEYPSKQTYDGKMFYQQSIAECLQIADIHLYNPKSENNHCTLLIENLIKYISLIMHPGLVTPTNIERCMQIAFNAKFNSGCLSRQVGAVITNESFYIKAIGWNDVPQGQVPCNLRFFENYFLEKDSNTFSDFELQDKKFFETMSRINSLYKQTDAGEFYPISYCFKDIYNGIKSDKNQVYTRALHAEENAFLQASKFGGQGIKGGKLFVTASPCELCSKKAYQLGIKEIYYIDPYPGISASHILKLGDSENNPKLNLFYGAVGNAYMSLYTQRFPYKDELSLFSGIDMKKVAREKNIIKQLEFDDVNYKDVNIELVFKNRHELEFVRTVNLTAKKDNIDSVQKGFSWTGSFSEKTVQNIKSKEYNIQEEFCVDGVNYCTLKLANPLKEGDDFNYSLKTLLYDEQETMRPFFSHHVKSLTDNLVIKIKVYKGVKIENIRLNEYADINKNVLFSTKDVKHDKKDDYDEYIFSIDNPSLFYTYSMEWDFVKVK